MQTPVPSSELHSIGTTSSAIYIVVCQQTHTCALSEGGAINLTFVVPFSSAISIRIIDNRAEPGLETSHVMRIVPYVIARAVRVAIGDTFSMLIDLIYAALSKKKEDITDCKKAGKECIYSD